MRSLFRPLSRHCSLVVQRQFDISGRNGTVLEIGNRTGLIFPATQSVRMAGLSRYYTITASGQSQSDKVTTTNAPKSKFCKECGQRMVLIIPEGDNKYRSRCTQCRFIDYYNPRMVVGSIVEHNDGILLVKRGTEPQLGKWTLPAGFQELDESSMEGAVRETLEEAGAAIEILHPYAHYDIVAIGQAYLFFRAQLKPPYHFAAQAPESIDAKLFPVDEIPFDELAFSSVSLALTSYVEEKQNGNFKFHHGKVVRHQDAGPNDPFSYSLEDHFSLKIST